MAKTHRQARDVSAHFQGEDRVSQHKADPKPAGYVAKLWVGARTRRNQVRFQRRAANGEAPGPTWRTSGCIGQV